MIRDGANNRGAIILYGPYISELVAIDELPVVLDATKLFPLPQVDLAKKLFLEPTLLPAVLFPASEAALCTI